MQFALTVAEPQELSALAAHLLTQKEYLKLPADALAALESVSPDSPLRLRHVGFRGARDEVADITISRPLLFALRSNTLDDLKAGLFDETPRPAFALDQFSISPEEIRTCAAALRGGHALLISGEPGIGKTEFARSHVHSLGRRAHNLASATRRSARIHGPRGEDGETSRFNSVRMAANLLTPATDILIVDEADAILQSAAGFFSLFSRGGSGGGNYDKAHLNDLLEHLPVPTVWITNEHRMIPSSALRR